MSNHYIGDDKFISFTLKPKLNEKVSFDDVRVITKKTFEKYRLKELESFFIIGQEISPQNYVWYWELMPDVISWKQKYGKSLHTTFKEYVMRKFNKHGEIIIFIAHVKHPNYFAFKYNIPNLDYLEQIDLVRTMKFEMNLGVSKITVPVGSSVEFAKIGVVDNYKKIKIYYNLHKFNIEMFNF